MIILSRVMQLLQCRKIKIRKSNEISRKSFFVCIEYKENTYTHIYTRFFDPSRADRCEFDRLLSKAEN